MHNDPHFPDDPGFDNWIMPFGKHKGTALKDIPVRYLDWLIGEDGIYQATKDKVKTHLENSRKSEWESLSQ